MDLHKILDLRKEKVLELSKKLNLEGQKAQVVLCLDYSGSMSNLYHNGAVQELVERILPLGLAFDDNGEVEMYIFDDRCTKIDYNITRNNIQGYVDKQILKEGYDMGGTAYEPVFKRIVRDFARIETEGGFLGLGGKKVFKTMALPVFVIFITDGENSDHQEAKEAIVEASKAGIFFQFIGIGDAGFQFLKRLDTMSGRNIDNANFFSIPDLSGKTDEELYELLLTEFPSFVKEARNKSLIK